MSTKKSAGRVFSSDGLSSMRKNYSDKFLERTIEIWQPRYGHSLSKEDAREIAYNTVTLLKYLAKLNRKYGAKLLTTEPEKKVA